MYPLFDTHKISEFLQMECYTKKPEVFELTHIPMKFRMRLQNAQHFSEVSENELVALICKGNMGIHEFRAVVSSAPTEFPNSQIILIRGHTGTGKTELCRYIEQSFRSGRYFQEQITRVPALSHDQIDEYHQQRKKTHCIRIEKGHLSALGALSIPLAFQSGQDSLSIDKKIEKVSESIKKGFYHLLRIKYDSEPMIWDKKIPYIEELLSDEDLFTNCLSKNIDRHLTNLRKIEESQEEELSKLELITKDDLNRMEIKVKSDEIEIINSQLIEQLANIMYSGGISTALRNFIEDSNQREIHPIIIMDDLSLVNRGNLREIFDAITGIASQNIKFSIVIGMTTGVFLDEIRNINNDTLKPRINEIDLSIDEGKITEWLNNKIFPFVENYLSLIRKDEHPINTNSDLFEDSPLFPFNSNFINRLKKFLPDTQLGFTPRGTISLILDILLSNKPVYLSADQFMQNNFSSNYNPLGPIQEDVRNNWEELIKACYWYGIITTEYYIISENDLKNLNFIKGDISHESFSFERDELKIKLKFNPIPSPRDSEREGSPGGELRPIDQEPLVMDLSNLNDWFQGKPLNTVTERNLSKIIQNSLRSINGADIRELSTKSSYVSKNKLRYSRGSNARIVFSRKPLANEAAIVFSPPEIKHNHELSITLSEDDYKQLVVDHHRENKLSVEVIERNYWNFDKVIGMYQRFLMNELERKMNTQFSKLLASLLIFIDSIVNNKYLPEDGYLGILKKIINIKYEDTQMNIINELFRSRILLRESILNMDELRKSIPANKNEIYKIIRDCNVNGISNFDVLVDKDRITIIQLLGIIYGRYITHIMKTKVNFEKEKNTLLELDSKVKKIDENLKPMLDNMVTLFDDIGKAGDLNLTLMFRLHKQKTNNLLLIYPDIEKLEAIKGKIHLNLNKNKLLSETEESFIWDNNWKLIKESGIIRFIGELEGLISDLKNDSSKMPSIEEELEKINKIGVISVEVVQ